VTPSGQEIQNYVLSVLQELAKDWDYSEAVGPESRLFTGLGFESLDAVVLGTAIQEHYQQEMPFAALFASIGQRDTHDLTIAELVQFVQTHLQSRNGDN
jgi:acyl carrier protein